MQQSRALNLAPALIADAPSSTNGRVFILGPHDRNTGIRTVCSSGSFANQLRCVVDCGDDFSWCQMLDHVAHAGDDDEVTVT